MTPLLKAQNVSKKVGPHLEILKEINLEIYPQEALAIVGKSGEGKSTLLHLLGFLDTPSNGTIEMRYPLPKALLRNKEIGFIFQHSHLLEEETVLDNVLMPTKLGKLPLNTQRALLLLEKVRLSHRLNFPVRVLSGGEKQRVAIARALINSPSLILADEPSGNLDSVHSQEIQQLLLNCVREEKKSLVVVTHDIEFAKQCDRVFLLKDGVLQTT
ncbi:MAG: transporter ATP-binding protein YtrE [Chlamydiota bacterium]|jgi:lipoprotein-releasing system ATP-binding protein